MLYLIDRKEKFYLSPFLALTLGLIRPDGVIIGVFIVLITFFLANKKQYKKIIIELGRTVSVEKAEIVF